MKRKGTCYQRFPDQRAPLMPELVVGLGRDHPAMLESRPLFPSTVVNARDAPRLLVGGHNSKKLGKFVTKGPLKGFRIYSLTLPERTTCPRSCHAWATCYGNAMHLARRHAPGPELERRLETEVAELALKHKKGGILIRLHALGDFYSVQYVELWKRLLTRHVNVHVFGYTAYLLDAAAEAERAIALAIVDLKVTFGRQFSIRWSAANRRAGGATIIDYVPITPRVAEGVVCPAELEKTQSCGTCGLCWNPSFRDETIVFVRHGMGVNQRPRQFSYRLAKPPGTAHPGRVPNQARARDAQKLAGTALSLRPAGGHHRSKRGKPGPIWGPRTGPSVTEGQIGDRTVRIVWPEA